MADSKVFVSYRSSDANKVRAVVDVLRAHGLELWFAEYEVLAANYDDFTVEVERGIREAVDTCSHGIAFTNRGWAESEYCKQEIAWLVERFGKGSPNLLQITMPQENLGEEVTPLLEGVTTYEYGEGDYSGAAEFILRHIAPDRSFRSPPVLRVENRQTLSSFGYWIEYSLGQYDCRWRPHHEPFANHEDHRIMRQYVGEFQGAKLNLLVTLVPPKRSIRRRFPRAMSRSATDREHYEYLRTLADVWHSDEPQDEHGLHLFVHNGRPRLGMTFLKHDCHEPAAWHRMYILHIGEGSRAVGEVHLSFGMPCEVGSESDLQRFHEIAPCLDAMAATVKYRGWSFWRRFTLWQWWLVFLFVVGCVGAFNTPSCQQFRSQLMKGELPIPPDQQEPAAPDRTDIPD
jgi:hypothetical protein